MSALVEWGRKKPPILAMMAHSVALAADAVYGARLLCREYAPTWGSIEYSEDWLNCYRDEKHVWQVVGKFFFDGSGEGEQSESEDQWTELWREWDDLQEVFERWKEKFAGKVKGAKYTRAIEELDAWLRSCRESGERLYSYYGEELVKELATSKDTIPDGPPPLEVYFLTHVLLPCWFEYKKKPCDLLKSAESGNWKSIEMLLRLDKFMLEHPPIMRAYTRATREKYRKRFDALHKAIEGAPPGPCKKAQVKIVLGAYILKSFREFDESLAQLQVKCPIIRFKPARLKVADIRRLFNAVAQDLHGLLEDPDLAEGDHAFYVATKRAFNSLPDEPIVSQNFFWECESKP